MVLLAFPQIEAVGPKDEQNLRACSTVQAGEVLGIQPTVLVLEPPKLVCRAVLGSYQRCLKDF